ncbi:Tn554-related, transposase C [Vibrio angustum S14]|uniref:Tn554-related, transposase C n=1 Tax=Photobacterium angustum (strain S14 / CCUG 15956) TaxID=314292 RepID=Q1ZMA9_PHOAS|nr:DUF6262 family protein [Photobacterium angustum]EAS63331.1 Tn554-related, transposase C [Vibrio angustum S14] [Photobacterium angustum S14]
MTHKRSTEAVTQKAKQKSVEATKKAEAAISELIKANENISVAKVAERAGVSRQWIYKNESMLGRIKRLSEQQSGKPKTPPKKSQSRSESSKDAIIAALQTRIKSLESENRELKSQLEVAYGELYAK